MKINNNILPHLTTLIVVFFIFFVSCNDDEKEPENIKIYNGITDQDMTMRLKTATIDGKLYVYFYKFTVIYADSLHYEEAELQGSSSEGLAEIKNNHFDMNLGDPDSYLTGDFNNTMDSLEGLYSYKFTDYDNVVSGQFWTLKE